MHFQLGPPPHTPQGSHAPWGGNCLRLGFSSTHACMTAQGAAQGYKNKGLKSSPPSFRLNLQPARATLFFFISINMFRVMQCLRTSRWTDNSRENRYSNFKCTRGRFQEPLQESGVSVSGCSRHVLTVGFVFGGRLPQGNSSLFYCFK